MLYNLTAVPTSVFVSVFLTPFISLYKDREKARFIHKIFRDDLAHFNTFMQELDTKMTWHDVYQSIESEMKTRHVDMERDEVKQLTDRKYQLFYPMIFQLVPDVHQRDSYINPVQILSCTGFIFYVFYNVFVRII